MKQQKTTFQQLLFYVKVLAILCLIILVLLTGNLLVKLSLLVAGNSGDLTQPQAFDIPGIFIASDDRHAIIYTLAVMIFLIFSFLQTFGTWWLHIDSKKRFLWRYKIKIVFLWEIICWILSLYWMIHFKIWASGQATLFLITLFLWISNSVAVALICFYLFIRKKQAMLVSSHLVDNHNQLPKKPITTIHEISPVTFQSFFNPELLKTYSYRRSLFYLNEKKRHLMFGLGQPWKVIFKICGPQMLFGVLAASYTFFIRFFLNHYYHFENSQWNIEQIRSSISVAVNYGSLIYIGMYLVISFVNIPAVIFFTRSFSQNKRQECEKILSFTLFLGIILIIFFTLFLYASTNSIIKLLGNGITGKGNPALAHLTRKMARALFYCTILLFTPLFIFELFSNMMIAEGRNITVLLINLFDFCCQPLFFFIFIKYIDLGTTYSIMVIPLADISVFCFSLIPLFYVVFRDPESFIRIRWRWLRFYRAISFDYFKIGFSVLLRILAIFMIRWINLSLLIYFAPWIGKYEFNNFNLFVALIVVVFFYLRIFFISLSVGARQLIAYCYNTGLHYRLKQILKRIFWMGVGWWLFFSVNLWWIAPRILHFINPDINVHNSFIGIYASAMFLGSVAILILWPAADLLQNMKYKGYVVSLFAFLFVTASCIGPFALWFLVMVLLPEIGDSSLIFMFCFNLWRTIIFAVIFAHAIKHFRNIIQWWQGLSEQQDRPYREHLEQFRKWLKSREANTIKTRVI